jgi:hypothetical protein
VHYKQPPQCGEHQLPRRRRSYTVPFHGALRGAYIPVFTRSTGTRINNHGRTGLDRRGTVGLQCNITFSIQTLYRALAARSGGDQEAMYLFCPGPQGGHGREKETALQQKNREEKGHQQFPSAPGVV